MTEAYKDSPEISTSGSLAAALEVSLLQAYVVVGDVLRKGTLKQQLEAAQALGRIATGSTELLAVWDSVVAADKDVTQSEPEATSPSHGVVLPETVRIPVSDQPSEPLLHIVTPPTEGLDEADMTGAPLPLAGPKEKENIGADKVRPPEDDIQHVAQPQEISEHEPAVSQIVAESAPTNKVVEPRPPKTKQPSEALPVDEEGFTEKERLILTYLQASDKRVIRGAELVEHYMQHFPCANVRAGRQAVGKAIRKIKANPDYAESLKMEGNTVARRYVYIETLHTENDPLASNAEVPAIAETLLSTLGTEEHVEPSMSFREESVPQPTESPLPEVEDNSSLENPGEITVTLDEVETVRLVGRRTLVDVREHSQQELPTQQKEAVGTPPPSDTVPSITEEFRASIDVSLLPPGFIPITRHGIGMVVDEEGKKTVYLKDKPHYLRGLPLTIFEFLITLDSGEAEYIVLKQSIEEKLGREISIKNFNIAINDLEKRLASDDSGFFNEIRFIDQTHFRYVGIRDMLSSGQREEIQRFLAPSSDGLLQG